jgi:polysaccharide biosynthesis/export protein
LLGGVKDDLTIYVTVIYGHFKGRFGGRASASRRGGTASERGPDLLTGGTSRRFQLRWIMRRSVTGTLLGTAAALVASTVWSPGWAADVVELTNGQRIEGIIKGVTARGLLMEAKGRDRIIPQRLVRRVTFAPTPPESSQTSGRVAPAVPESQPARARAIAPAAVPPTTATHEPDVPVPALPPGAERMREPPTSTPSQAARSTPAALAAGAGGGVAPLPRRPDMILQIAGRPAAGYEIGPDDLLDIVVWKNTAISRTVPVRPDGKISLPLLNDVQAAGLTPMQLQQELVTGLRAFIQEPEVSVIVREVRSFKVSVLGEVQKAGQYELKGRATVLDVIARAGGFTPFASRARIVILRVAGATVERIPFNFKKAVGSGEQAAFLVEPGDVVVVP